MNQFVVDYLNKNFKYQITKDSDMYNKIDTWNLLYKNDREKGKYVDNYGITRYRYTLGMAKRIAEDWASIGFTEKDEISVNKKITRNLLKSL